MAIFVGVVLPGIGVLRLTGVLSGPVALGAAGGAVAGWLLIWALWHFVTMPYHVRKVYRESAALRERTTIACDDEAITFTQESGNWRLKWCEAARWDEAETIFAVFPNRAMAHILPKRDLSSEIIDFVRERLIVSGLTQPWKLRK
ncbi:YcxB family protein [Aurantiacibacter suaedae]|uniref:YcxB family protein n=1 Tax=Aurantiacibacter suaedae TaxID=2545755 RepID=UPI0013873304|nr:YcxB family protein [Aurantiacibacter suaedae]